MKIKKNCIQVTNCEEKRIDIDHESTGRIQLTFCMIKGIVDRCAHL
jgi:hypothetical protein